MNALQKAQDAYGNSARTVKTHRDTEYDIFARITSRLKQAEARGATGFADLTAALHDNRRLWALLVSDVAGKSNALPAELRAQILYLARFTHEHTSKVLRRDETAAPLVEINTAIMRGLRHGGG